MPVHASIRGKHTLVIAGIDTDVPRSVARSWAADVAELVEQRIAEDFSKERAAGRAIRDYGEAHEQRKARDGLLMEKGHMTGRTQDELDDGGFATISAFSGGRITITLSEQKLMNRVAYVEYFAEQKVAGGLILVLLQKDAREAESYINVRMEDFRKASRRGRAGRSARPRLRTRAVSGGLGTRVTI